MNVSVLKTMTHEVRQPLPQDVESSNSTDQTFSAAFLFKTEKSKSPFHNSSLPVMILSDHRQFILAQLGQHPLE